MCMLKGWVHCYIGPIPNQAAIYKKKDFSSLHGAWMRNEPSHLLLSLAAELHGFRVCTYKCLKYGGLFSWTVIKEQVIQMYGEINKQIQYAVP